MKHLDAVEEGQERALEIEALKIGDALDPALEQDNDDCQEIGYSDNPDFVFKSPLEYNCNQEQSNRYQSINVFNEEALDSMTQQLDEDQRKVLEIGIDYAKSLVKSKKSKKAIKPPPLLVVQGGAGSGKSTVIDVVSG